MILDPSSKAPIVSVGSIHISDVPSISDKARQFGHVPNIRQMLPGDLILTSPINNSKAARLIKFTQRRSNLVHYEWTHAAIYVSDWTIIEARPTKGIHKSVLHTYIPNHRLKIRRINQIATQGVDQAMILGLRLVLAAALRMPNSTYAYAHAINEFSDKMRRISKPFRPRYRHADGNYHVCSSLYDECAVAATGAQLFPNIKLSSNEMITPSTLSGASTMTDIAVGWLKII